MFADLAKALGAAFSIWEHKEKNKYRDKLLSLQREYYAEINKPLEARSDAVLDALEFELRILGRSFASSVTGE